MSVRVSARLSAWNNSASSGRIFMKFDIWVFFETSVEKIKVLLKCRHLGLYTFWKYLDKFLLDWKQLENVGCFKYLSRMLTKDGRWKCEIKCMIAMAKAAFNKKRALFTSTLDFKLRTKLVKCYIWSTAFYGAEACTLRAIDQKRLERLEMWCWNCWESNL